MKDAVRYIEANGDPIDNDESIFATPDHLFMTRDGRTYKILPRHLRASRIRRMLD